MKTMKAQDRLDEPVTEAVLAQAVARGKKRQDHGLHATTIEYLPTQNSLLIGFADQSAVALPVRNYPELDRLTPAELTQLTLGFGGSALCMESHDLHISIAGLVSASQSLMDMAASVIAARNGSRRSAAKAASSRENGQKGGRPRKAVAGL